jgi:putative tricarboxylic transport membrane protein
MDLLSNLSLGFSQALSLQNLAYCFIGALYGTVIGVLPGIGPVVGISILLPITFSLPPVSAVIMLAGIYYGSAYGGSTTSILVNAPGEASAVVTCLDGYEMAKQGRAKAALATAAIGSFIAGTIATIAIMLLALPIARLGLKFTPAEYFALLFLALTLVGTLATESPVKGLYSALVGLFLSTVGMDLQTGQVRFAFGSPWLLEGIDFIVVAIGLFAISEVLIQAETIHRFGLQKREQISGQYWITWDELKQSFMPYMRGTVLGFLVGILPGAGSTPATFFSYAVEKRSSKHPEKFGKGAIEGVAGPEAANNAANQGALVPLLTLGIPGSATTAIMLGAFMIYGIQPGPLLFEKNPAFVWAIIASMYIGNVILLILNLPLVNIFARLLDLPAALLYSMVLAFCTLGVYSMRFAIFDVYLMIIFGIVGFFMKKHNYPAAPLLLALVLGDMMEQGLRRALTLANGDWSVFVRRPICLVLLSIAVLSIGYSLMKHTREKGQPA